MNVNYVKVLFIVNFYPQARHIAPHDSLLLFNLALVQRLLASSVLRNDQSSLSVVLAAVRELEMAQRHCCCLKQRRLIGRSLTFSSPAMKLGEFAHQLRPSLVPSQNFF